MLYEGWQLGEGKKVVTQTTQVYESHFIIVGYKILNQYFFAKKKPLDMKSWKGWIADNHVSVIKLEGRWP